MKAHRKALRILAAGLALATSASVLPAAAQTNGNLPKAASKSLAANLAISEGATVESIIASWSPTLTTAFGWSAEGIDDLQVRLSQLPASALPALAAQTSWNGFTSLLASYGTNDETSRRTIDERDPQIGVAKSLAQKALGDQNRDLTFIPTKPCRIFDTRTESIGSPYNGRYTGANTKYFWAFNSSGTGDFSGYGGNTGCIENVETNASTLAGTAPYAVMIKLTIVGPSAAGSYVSAVRSGDTNPAPNLVSAYCDQLGNGAPCFATVVVPVCRGTTGCTGTRDLAILSNMAMDLAGEVQGYFVKPQATALDCTNVNALGTAAVSTDTYLALPACAAGYSRTGGYCFGAAGNSSGYLLETGASGCDYRNLSGSTTFSIGAVSTCCRVPGR